MARGRSIGNIYAELSVKDKMPVGLRRAEKSLGTFSKRALKIGAGLVAAIPAAALAGIAAAAKSAIDAGGKLSDVMAQTGAKGEGLFTLGRAFDNAGVGGDKVAGVLNKMQKALAGVNEEGKQVTSRVFRDLGLSISELRASDPVEAFRSISAGIAGISDPAKRAALAMEIFGRSGGELLVVMQDSSAFKNAADQVGGLGKTLAANANELDRISDAMGLFEVKSQQLGAEVAVSLLPELTKFAAWAETVDFSAVGGGIGIMAEKMVGLAEAAEKASKYLPGVIAMNKMAGWAIGTEADGDKAKQMAADWSANDPDFMKSNSAAVRAAEEVAATGLASSEFQQKHHEWYLEYNKTYDLAKTKAQALAAVEKKRLDQAMAASKLIEKSHAWVGEFPLEMGGIPGIAGIMEMISDYPKQAGGGRDWESSSIEVNDYQRRGLGLGGMGADGRKTEEHLASMRQALEFIARKMKQDPGDLVF